MSCDRTSSSGVARGLIPRFCGRVTLLGESQMWAETLSTEMSLGPFNHPRRLDHGGHTDHGGQRHGLRERQRQASPSSGEAWPRVCMSAFDSSTASRQPIQPESG
jgi:hypothetical protein